MVKLICSITKVLNLYIVRSLILTTEYEYTHNFHFMKVKKWFSWQYD